MCPPESREAVHSDELTLPRFSRYTSGLLSDLHSGESLDGRLFGLSTLAAEEGDPDRSREQELTNIDWSKPEVVEARIWLERRHHDAAKR